MDDRTTVALNQWRDHWANHRATRDDGCPYCDDDPRFAPGHTWNPHTNVITKEQ